MARLAIVMMSLVLLGGCGTLCLGDGSGLDKPAGSSVPEPQ
ncbi:uncharacterized protein YceK [Caulobacter ginsengisoli]|uniref:Uncharacterized protein YceK n=1 Tax=Caulobacter ginsengisoli TaxID=400775 RepID=A0ABU0IU27_9CAUL|nr:hypothetical protein [Caulobacter ginsengisoli]MDQ0465499.1 uncharacterized protein YceK [Caulobacter ginsengisoli]